MNIYIDFDDCLCETGRAFTSIVKRMYDLDIPYDDIKSFNLQQSFSLTDEQYEKMMIEAHTEEVLLSFEETPGASTVINKWIDMGHNVSIITGRPIAAYDSSRKWLDAHNLGRVRLYCLNKYGRDTFLKGSEYSLELEDYYKMHFDIAVEDSPLAFKFFDHLPELRVMVFNRPWNRECTLPSDNYHRCVSWQMIDEAVNG